MSPLTTILLVGSVVGGLLNDDAVAYALLVAALLVEFALVPADRD